MTASFACAAAPALKWEIMSVRFSVGFTSETAQLIFIKLGIKFLQYRLLGRFLLSPICPLLHMKPKSDFVNFLKHSLSHRSVADLYTNISFLQLYLTHSTYKGKAVPLIN
jgi:hypothetical protein